MKPTLTIQALILALLGTVITIGACSSESSTTATASTSAQPSFTDKKWIVKKSNAVAAGQSYEFLSGGRLKINAPQQQPAEGTWSYKDKKLVMNEESMSYPVDILELTEQTFKIRMHNPGEAIEIEFSH